MIQGYSLNFIEMVKVQLSHQIKQELTEKLVAEELASYEEKLRGTIKAIVENVAIDEVEHIRSDMKMRDELHVFMTWKDKD